MFKLYTNDYIEYLLCARGTLTKAFLTFNCTRPICVVILVKAYTGFRLIEVAFSARDMTALIIIGAFASENCNSFKKDQIFDCNDEATRVKSKHLRTNMHYRTSYKKSRIDF